MDGHKTFKCLKDSELVKGRTGTKVIHLRVFETRFTEFNTKINLNKSFLKLMERCITKFLRNYCFLLVHFLIDLEELKIM